MVLTCADNASASSEKLGVSIEYAFVFLPYSYIIGAAS